jgi:hypothetical protein
MEAKRTRLVAVQQQFMEDNKDDEINMQQTLGQLYGFINEDLPV